jgi:GH15 family glucan-1,4-alpha-glucosidase
MRLEELGLIGNCQYSALVAADGDVAWCCLPRFDAAPVFGGLLDADEGGRFLVAPAAGGIGTQRYLENTNVLETTFEAPDGAFRVLDFAPRFTVHERSFRPTKLIRVVEPLRGTPRVRVACEPVLGWDKGRPRVEHGSNHIDYVGYPVPVRLTTDVPLAYIGGPGFALSERKHLVFSWGAPVEEPLRPLCTRFLDETVAYWTRWVKHCDIPPLFQHEVIRSALALKLHCFEDTGAIVASMTTSIPESPGSGRTWDYRYCWLRDAYFVLGAFERLGQHEERDRFLHYLLTVAASAEDLELAPLYSVDGSRELPETVHARWAGYEGNGPVRTGNAAVEQVQNDIYGELVLALVPVFLDERFHREQTEATLDLLTRLTRKAIAVAGRPEAGIWEYRRPVQGWHTFSVLMSWAAADRMCLVAERHRPDLVDEFRRGADRLRDEILRLGWNDTLGSFVGVHGGELLDASVLHTVLLRLVGADDPRAAATIDVHRAALEEEGWMYRYRMDDGLGQPAVTFVICTFWLVESLARIGRVEEARRLLGIIFAQMPPLGLMSEDYDPRSGRFWGNFPQAYSHVGLIRAAFAASPRWDEVL